MSSDPPFADDTDEAVSAFIDGELAGFAEDRGISGADARALLEAWDGFSGRRVELEEARAAIAAGVGAVDDVTRNRLVAGATAPPATARAAAARDGRTRRRPRTPLVVGAAAAAVVVLVIATVAALTLDNGPRAKTSRAAAGSAASALEQLARRGGDPYVGALGDVTEPGSLRRALEQRGAFRSTNDTAPAAAQAAPTSPSASGTEAGAGDRAAATACARSLTAGGAAAGKAVVLLGGALVNGRAAVVVAVADRGRVVAFVVARDGCEVLSAQSL